MRSVSTDEVTLVPLHKGIDIQIRMGNQAASLPPEMQHRIEQHWNAANTINSKLFRGPVLFVSDYEVGNSFIKCTVSVSDYAHYLATFHKIIPRKFFCRSLYVSVIVLTSDNYLIFGQMGTHTSAPGQIQCIGGGVTDKHIRPDSGVDINIVAAAHEELKEELYLEANNPLHISSMRPAFFKMGGDLGTMGFIFEAHTPLPMSDVAKLYDLGVAQEIALGKTPEFCALIPIRNTSADIEEFLSTNTHSLSEHMKALFRKYGHPSRKRNFI